MLLLPDLFKLHGQVPNLALPHGNLVRLMNTQNLFHLIDTKKVAWIISHLCPVVFFKDPGGLGLAEKAPVS